MKKIHYYLFMVLLVFVSACDKDEEEILPDSLILAKATNAQYVLVNPDNGQDIYRIEPGTREITEIASGFNSNKVFITSHSGPNTSIKTLYSIDAGTGENLTAITNEAELDVQRISASSFAPILVFSADEVDSKLISFQIFSLTEDGLNQNQLTYYEEGIDCPDSKVSMKIVTTNFPAWSPDNSKIVFSASLRELPPANHPHHAIIIMDPNGQNKEVLYMVPKEQTHYEDFSWTPDGKFIIFTMLEDDFHRRVKLLKVDDKQLTDITDYLEAAGEEVENLSICPDLNKLVFNQHLGGGSDLFIIPFDTENDSFIFTGPPVQITDKASTGNKYYIPFWNLWDQQ